MDKKKIIWIDIGTHFGQEYNSIFGSDINFLYHILRRFVGGNILGRGKSINIPSIKNIFYTRNNIRKYTKDFYTVFVEANHNIARKKFFYPHANLFFNIALTDNTNKSTSIIKLYLGNNEVHSQGSSIFLEKHNVKQDNFIMALGVSPNDFFKELDLHLREKFDEYALILRLNCEGVEDSIIYSAQNYFGDKLELICGSLKDVKEIKGSEAYNKLEKFIADNNIVFTNFSSHINSWEAGQKAILRLLKKI